MKKIEVSKKILLYCDIQLTISIITLFIAMFLDKNVDGMVQLVISLIALSATAHSFYYWKAKAENLQKFGKEDEIVIDPETGEEEVFHYEPQ